MENDKKSANPLLDVDLLEENEVEEILKEFEDSSEETLEEEKEGGVSVEEQAAEGVTPEFEAALVQVSVRIPRILRTRAKIVAARHQITLSTLIIKGLETILDQLRLTPHHSKTAKSK